ncbi:MAG: ribonuclease P protein component [Alphaproteobacteria bacterium]|nr:ribonuclease P protein component [Alphaproteobacteria bacterium]
MKIFILKKRKDFIRAAQGVKSVQSSLILQAAPSLSAPKKIVCDDTCYVGYTATKKLGKAHVRNRVKRRLRAAVACVFSSQACEKIDYVLIGRFKTASAPFAKIIEDLQNALNEVKSQLTEKNE